MLHTRHINSNTGDSNFEYHTTPTFAKMGNWIEMKE